MRFLARADLFGIVSFRPLSRHQELLAKHGISSGDALQDLYGIDRSGRVFAGYDLYTELARRMLLLVPAWPLLVLGRWLRAAPRLSMDRRTADPAVRCMRARRAPSAEQTRVTSRRAPRPGNRC